MATKSKPPVTEVATSGEVVVPASAKWTALVEKFASTTGFGAEFISSKLKSLTGTEDDAGVELLENTTDTPDSDVKGQFLGDNVAPARLNRAIREMRAAEATTIPNATQVPQVAAPVAASQANMALSLLPSLPIDDQGFLDMLKVGGVAKVDPIDVVAAVQAVITDRLGLNGIEERLADSILKHADGTDDPAPPVYYRLLRQSKRRAYGDILAALDATGISMSEPEKKRVITKVSDIFGHLEEFNARLNEWFDAWQAQGAGPMMMQALMASLSGMQSPFAAMAQQPPDTSALITAHETFVNALNKMFSGTGKPVCRALAADGITTRANLRDPEIVSALGYASYDEMVKREKLAVASDVVRGMNDLNRYILGVMQMDKKGTDELPAYCFALLTCAKRIPWSTLSGRSFASNNRPSTDSRPFPGESRKY